MTRVSFKSLVLALFGGSAKAGRRYALSGRRRAKLAPVVEVTLEELKANKRERAMRRIR